MVSCFCFILFLWFWRGIVSLSEYLCSVCTRPQHTLWFPLLVFPWIIPPGRFIPCITCIFLLFPTNTSLYLSWIYVVNAKNRIMFYVELCKVYLPMKKNVGYKRHGDFFGLNSVENLSRSSNISKITSCDFT